MNNNKQAFFALVGAGLWERGVRLSQFEDINLKTIYRYAQEQSVAGIVAAGLEHVSDVKLPKEDILVFVGDALQLEHRNVAMNNFIGVLVDKMKKASINLVLVKGQGVAQCYEKPLWRAAGDVDFFLDKENYNKAQSFLKPLASHIDEEEKRKCHLGMTIDSWILELHGTMFTDISEKMNIVSAEVQRNIFELGGVRYWNNDGVDVLLPSADNDVIIIFNHFINHFYGEGVGLRQICDWCRLLWKFQDVINVALLENRIIRMGLMKEWKAFAYFAVEYLGMPERMMPLYEKTTTYSRKADLICQIILQTGNMGQNKNNSYRAKYPRLLSYFITFFRRLGEFARLTRIFPNNAPMFFLNYVFHRVKATV